MIGLTVSLQGEEKAHLLLRRLVNAESLIAQELGEWAEETLDSELYGMVNYAPPPPNSTYIRTGRLGANWGLRRVNRLAAEFFNFTPYVAYVVGNEQGGRQAAIHAGRWWLGRKKIEARLPLLTERLQRRFNKLA